MGFFTTPSNDKDVSSIVKSCFQKLSDIHRIHPFIPKSAAVPLANSCFAQSCQYFYNGLFYCLPNSIHRLQKVQTKVARIVINSSHFLHITKIFKYLYWLPISYHINLKIFCIAWCAFSLCGPFYLGTLPTHQSNSHSLRFTSFSPVLLVHFNKKSNGFRMCSNAVPFLWYRLYHTARSTST